MRIKDRNNKCKFLFYHKLLKYLFSYALSCIQMFLHTNVYNNTNSMYKNVTS